MPKAIFFDLDGTLTDSGPGIMNCAEPALAHFGSQDLLPAHQQSHRL